MNRNLNEGNREQQKSELMFEDLRLIIRKIEIEVSMLIESEV